MSTATFILAIKDSAIQYYQAGGFRASITIAQGILESASGTSELAQRANNLFGITAGSNWGGSTYTIGNYVYRVYTSWSASIYDHYLFTNTARYANVRNATTLSQALAALQASGYAEDPTYSSQLSNIINYYNLTQYDNESPQPPHGYIKVPQLDIMQMLGNKIRRYYK